jgi:XapX domain-containing protein
MWLYLQVAAVAVIVGAVYALIRVKSPAPPIVAIVGLAGLLVAGTILQSL